MTTRIESAVPEQLKAFARAKAFRATLAARAYPDDAHQSRAEWMRTVEQDRQRIAKVEQTRIERELALAEEKQRAADLAAAKVRLAARVVEDEGPIKVPLRAIHEITARYFKITVVELISDRRAANLVRARHVGLFLAREMLPWSFPKIGRAFGKRDHTTVLHAVRRITDACRSSQSFAAEVDVVRQAILVAAFAAASAVPPSPQIVGAEAR